MFLICTDRAVLLGQLIKEATVDGTYNSDRSDLRYRNLVESGNLEDGAVDGRKK
jgi:hypothetical protein